MWTNMVTGIKVMRRTFNEEGSDLGGKVKWWMTKTPKQGG